MVLETPALGRVVASATQDADLFWATAGGMGLTGLIAEATMRLLPIETAYMRVDSERAHDLDDAMARMAEADQQYRYSVAWIDCLARGRSLGAVGARVRRPRRPRRPPAPTGATRPRPFASAPSTGPRPRPGPPRACSTPGPSPPSTRCGTARRRHDARATWCRPPASSILSMASAGGTGSTAVGGLVQYQMVVPDGAEDTVRRTRRGLEQRSLRLVSGRAQALRAGQSRPPVLPAVGLDARPRHAGRRRRPGRAAGWPGRDGRGRRRPGVPGQGRPTATRAAGGHVSSPPGLAGGARPRGSRPPALLRPGPPAARPAGPPSPGRLAG